MDENNGGIRSPLYPQKIKRGDPLPVDEVVKLWIADDERGLRNSLANRVKLEMMARPLSCATMHTLTFAHDPGRHLATMALDEWLKRLIAHNNDLINARLKLDPESETALQLPLASVMHCSYLAALERGKLGRLHWHVVTIQPWYLQYREWKRNMLRWRHGHHHHKLVDDPNAGFYVAKYVTKEGEYRCNSNLGLTITLTALCSCSFRALASVSPILALKLLRRLSLTRSWPGSPDLPYLISSDKHSTIFKRARARLSLTTTMIGGNAFGTAPSNVGKGCETLRGGAMALVRQAVREFRSPAFGKVYPEFPDVCVGLRSFGKVSPRSSGLEAYARTAVWKTSVRYPERAAARSK